jgi:nitroreductase
MSFLSQLNWRYATKKFSDKKVSDENISTIKNAIRMSPTSFGLQPFHVVVVTNPELRTQLRAAAWDQAQITDSSHLFVFCARNDFTDRIETYMQHTAEIQGTDRANLQGFADMISGTVAMHGDRVTEWATHQAYITLGFGLAACAELGIDSCPMEGFDRTQFEKILELPEYVKARAVMAVGYRDDTDSAITRPKVRFPESDLFTDM